MAKQEEDAKARRRYITRAEVQKHGESPKCKACTGESNVHTPACRARFERNWAKQKLEWLGPVPAKAVAAKPSENEEADQGPGSQTAPGTASDTLAPFEAAWQTATQAQTAERPLQERMGSTPVRAAASFR